MLNGVNQSTFFILPMLGERHPESYPRFRDCFVNNEGDKPEIHLYTRTGGGNRDDYESEIKELQKHPNYLWDKDDDFDCTYATFAFSVPDEFKDDFDKITQGNLKETSKEYQERLRKSLPKLAEKFDEIFN
jgi:hypothetical protein